MDIVVWLRSLGLGKYEALFRENDIDETVLPSLTDENLKELGVTALGHRLKLLDAIAALRKTAPAPEEKTNDEQARRADGLAVELADLQRLAVQRHRCAVIGEASVGSGKVRAEIGLEGAGQLTMSRARRTQSSVLHWCTWHKTAISLSTAPFEYLGAPAASRIFFWGLVSASAGNSRWPQSDVMRRRVGTIAGMVFPTAGMHPPTLTIAALALRAARAIQQSFAG